MVIFGGDLVAMVTVEYRNSEMYTWHPVCVIASKTIRLHEN
jgi:hypothetical protein